MERCPRKRRQSQFQRHRERRRSTISRPSPAECPRSRLGQLSVSRAGPCSSAVTVQRDRRIPLHIRRLEVLSLIHIPHTFGSCRFDCQGDPAFLPAFATWRDTRDCSPLWSVIRRSRRTNRSHESSPPPLRPLSPSLGTHLGRDRAKSSLAVSIGPAL